MQEIFLIRLEAFGGTCPYGYKKNPDNIHQLIIDEEEAPVVRKIFKMALDGFGHIKIARFLNDNGILCRKEVQRRKKYKLSMSSEDEEIVYHWSTSTIGKMVTSEIYIGNLVWNRTGSISYKDHRQIYKPKSEWVIVEGTHEGIISVEDFNKIQETIKERLNTYYKNTKPLIDYYKNEGLLESINIDLYSETTKEDTTKSAIEKIEKRIK